MSTSLKRQKLEDALPKAFAASDCDRAMLDCELRGTAQQLGELLLDSARSKHQAPSDLTPKQAKSWLMFVVMDLHMYKVKESEDILKLFYCHCNGDVDGHDDRTEAFCGIKTAGRVCRGDHAVVGALCDLKTQEVFNQIINREWGLYIKRWRTRCASPVEQKRRIQLRYMRIGDIIQYTQEPVDIKDIELAAALHTLGFVDKVWRSGEEWIVYTKIETPKYQCKYLRETPTGRGINRLWDVV